MEKGILKKRLKGLLALSLAFYLMFGNGIQVLAATQYNIKDFVQNNHYDLKAGDGISYYIEYTSGGIGRSGIIINDDVKVQQKTPLYGGSGGTEIYVVNDNIKVKVIENTCTDSEPYGTLKLATLHQINVSASLQDGGTVTGGGEYTHNSQATLTATANNGYQFKEWQKDGQKVSEDSSYTIIVDGDRTLVAVFEQDQPNQDPSGQTPTLDPAPTPGQTPGGGSGQNNPPQPSDQDTTPAPSTGGSHTHNFKWEITLEPTETTDGRAEYCCECGHVEQVQPISFFGAIIKRILGSIEEAPQNGTVLVENKFLRCLPDEVIEALQKRSDVNLEVKFTEQEIKYHFLIPAGTAPTEGEEWYGYFYLGGRYGWKQ